MSKRSNLLVRSAVAVLIAAIVGCGSKPASEQQAVQQPASPATGQAATGAKASESLDGLMELSPEDRAGH